MLAILGALATIILVGITSILFVTGQIGEQKISTAIAQVSQIAPTTSSPTIVFVASTIAPIDTPLPTPVPSPTIAPTPTQPTAIKVTADNTKVMSGPGNDGYSVVANLTRDDFVTPLGIFGDFVKVELIVNGKSQQGFIPAALLEPIASKLPELKTGDVPWRMSKVFFSPAQPGKFINNSRDGSGYKHDLVPGGMLNVSGEIELQIQFSEIDNSKSISFDRPSNGLWIDTGLGANIKSLAFFHQGAFWRICSDCGQSGGRTVMVLNTLNTSQDISLRFNATGSAVTVDFSGSFATPVYLPSPIFSGETNTRIQIQTAPGSSVTVSRLYLLIPPSNKLTHP
jgi:hypothetical protein